MGSQNCRQQQYALYLADKSGRRSALRAHNLMEVSPLIIWTSILTNKKLFSTEEFTLDLTNEKASLAVGGLIQAWRPKGLQQTTNGKVVR